MVRRLFYILFVLLAANSCLAYDFPEFSKQVENIFGVSKKAPFANALAQVDGAEVVFRDLRDWFEYVSENVSSRRAIEDGPVCTLRGQDWIEDVVRYMTDRRLVPPVKTCATRTEHSLEVDLARAFSLMNRNAEVSERRETRLSATTRRCRYSGTT